MAGKGGAWKVAYADFVTAMMAFFLVMWLISQDQKIKESVARYFQAPAGLRLFDASTKPADSGGFFDADLAGSVPESRLRSAGRGLGDAQDPTDPDNETQIVSEWLFDEAGMADEWQPIAREQIRRSEELMFDGTDMEREEQAAEFARRQLAIQLQNMVLQETEAIESEIARNLLYRAVSRVEWQRVAEECLWELRDGSDETSSLQARQLDEAAGVLR
jgi:flagellar motor protein MotB